jgi:hypothetical protein
MLTQLQEDSVREIVLGFITSNTLFTALDVSNEVKETFPQVRHREVRDTVRALFTSHIEPAGWARTDITVTLEGGNTATALLYYPLSASWDLDAQYSDQKRAQKSVKTPQIVSAAVNSSGSVTVQSAVGLTVNVPAAQATTTMQVAQTAARDLWKQMFSSQPSLFPRR